MSDEYFYAQAAAEIESNSVVSAIWTKAITLEKGDKANAEYQYIQLRVVQLAEEAGWVKQSVLDAPIVNGNSVSKKSTRRIAGFFSLLLGLSFLFFGLYALGSSKTMTIGPAIATLFLFLGMAYFPIRDGYVEMIGSGFADVGTTSIGIILSVGQFAILYLWMEERGVPFSVIVSTPLHLETLLPYMIVIFVGLFLTWFGWSGSSRKTDNYSPQ